MSCLNGIWMNLAVVVFAANGAQVYLIKNPETGVQKEKAL